MKYKEYIVGIVSAKDNSIQVVVSLIDYHVRYNILFSHKCDVSFWLGSARLFKDQITHTPERTEI